MIFQKSLSKVAIFGLRFQIFQPKPHSSKHTRTTTHYFHVSNDFMGREIEQPLDNQEKFVFLGGNIEIAKANFRRFQHPETSTWVKFYIISERNVVLTFKKGSLS